ncbi:hypothetical protein LEP48_18200 [Isoptericola sp. NEAU-Y5]|uniref:Lipoprotein n=1 Tax=Isoptericola luteus TaxID=2879484 RepID=A0ABS7ZJR8_9MICO|nr:hypothetical protein [Isoptericola sp. NEAU-Y5]MCA5895263.1 hypothetical protein [Isoptericola sp. NEAU-Y5]
MRTLTKPAALATAGLVALSLGACASDEPTAPPGAADAPAQAEITTTADLTDLAALMATAQGDASSSHVEMTYSGELADAAGLSASTTTADVDYGKTVADTSMRMSMAVMGMDMEMLLVDGTMYVGMGEATQGQYFSMSLEEMADDPSLAGALDSMDSMDAGAQAEALAGAVTAFEHTGTEQVDGAEVDVYTVTIDPTKLEDGGATGIDAPMSEELGEMTAVYKVDAQGLPVEVDIAMTIDGQELVIESAFSAWGEPVEIVAPADEDVVPYSDLMTQN